MSKNYEGTYRFTKVINEEGKEVFIPTEIEPPLVVANNDGTYSPMAASPVGPFKLQLKKVVVEDDDDDDDGDGDGDDTPNNHTTTTYHMSTRVVNRISCRIVISSSIASSSSDDDKDGPHLGDTIAAAPARDGERGGGIFMTQVASFVPEMRCLESATKDVMKKATNISLDSEGNELTLLQAPNGCAIHCIRDVTTSSNDDA